MKLQKTLLIIFLNLTFLTTSQVLAADVISTVSNSTQVTDGIKAQAAENEKYSGYTIDGFTSASKLAAQRSHTVEGKEERNFAVFTGIVVVLIVYIFSQFVFNKN